MKVAVKDVQTKIRREWSKFHAESRAHLLRLSAVADEIFQAMSIAGIAIPLEPWSLRKRESHVHSNANILQTPWGLTISLPVDTCWKYVNIENMQLINYVHSIYNASNMFSITSTNEPDEFSMNLHHVFFICRPCATQSATSWNFAPRFEGAAWDTTSSAQRMRWEICSGKWQSWGDSWQQEKINMRGEMCKMEMLIGWCLMITRLFNTSDGQILK